jgi:hypothetical protein
MDATPIKSHSNNRQSSVHQTSAECICVRACPAESSITFDDVTVVINSCRVNVASFDPINNMPQLGPQVTGRGAVRGGDVRVGFSPAEQHALYMVCTSQRTPLQSSNNQLSQELMGPIGWADI